MKKFTLTILTAIFSICAFAQSDIVITEIMYNPPEAGNDSLEFVELYNKGNAAIDLGGWYFNSGVDFTFPANTMIQPGGYVLVAIDSVSLLNVFGVTAVGEFQGSTALSNSGENVVLHNAGGMEMDSVAFDDNAPWPTEPDGNGPSLVLCDPSLPNADNTNWVASTQATGIMINGLEIFATPGAGCSSTPPPSCPMLYVNEVMASNSTTVADEQGEYDDWFEVYNPNNFSVDIAGYYVTDDMNDLTKFQILTGYSETIIPANGYVLVWCDDASSVAGPLNANFKLSASGEAAAIVCTDGTTVIDQVTFPAMNTDESYGRQSDGNSTWVTFTTPTPNATNSVVSSNFPEASSVKVIKAFPNPVNNGFVNFNSNVTGVVYNNFGQVITSLNNASRLDVNGWNTGVYTLRTEDNRTSTFIVK